eukprot:TRINITY_DN23171_c0_g1_i1.p1 TRINITY_DN23171_c0_g1~~TRINITY_DN23171_c0_g1_i1.p1  ORF type:complete len:531 (-),score=133.03 TRINITY_DN23171_c0_g1_i1:225-1721(-)
MEGTGLPLMPLVPSSPSPAPVNPPEESSTGFAFVRDVMRELSGLHNGLASLKDQLGQLRTDLEREQLSRTDDTANLRREMVRGFEDERKLRVDLEGKHESFVNLSKTWIASLGKDGMATKERLNGLDAAMEQRVSQLAGHEERLKHLDTVMATKCTVENFKHLKSTVSDLQAEVVRDRASAQAALESATRELTRNIRATEASLDELKQTVDTSTKALQTDTSVVSDKVESLDALTKTLCRNRDHEMLDERVLKAEKTLHAATEELSRKAAAAAMKSLSDRVTEMSMEAHSTQTRNQMIMDEHTAKLGDLEKETAKQDRQFEMNRSQVSGCLVALEKELTDKATVADSETLSARMTTAATAIQRLETLATTKVSVDTFEKMGVRMDNLEVSLIKKAESESLGRTAQAVTEQARQLEMVASQLRNQKGQVEVLEGRSDTMKTEIEKKAEANNVYTSAGVDSMFKSYYSREEVDAILSRVWWRLGDVCKTPTTPSTRVPTR